MYSLVLFSMYFKSPIHTTANTMEIYYANSTLSMKLVTRDKASILHLLPWRLNREPTPAACCNINLITPCALYLAPSPTDAFCFPGGCYPPSTAFYLLSTPRATSYYLLSSLCFPLYIILATLSLPVLVFRSAYNPNVTNLYWRTSNTSKTSREEDEILKYPHLPLVKILSGFENTEMFLVITTYILFG